MLRKIRQTQAPSHSNYLMLAGTVIGIWQMGRAAEVSHRSLAGDVGDREFHESKIITADFYADQIYPRSATYLDCIRSGGDSTMALQDDQF